MENEEVRRIPKEAFDSEYMTERRREVEFLGKKGILYTYTKEKPEYGIIQYKYRKTPALFAALVEFYTRMEVENELRRPRRDEKLDADKIREMQETLSRLASQVNKTEQDDTE